MKCPVCGNETKDNVCSQCGYLIEYDMIMKNMIHSLAQQEIDDYHHYVDINKRVYKQNTADTKMIKDVYNIAKEFFENKKYLEALKLYEMLANYNDMSSVFKIGYMYDMGLGVEQDYLKAIEYYQKAIKLGSHGAYNNLGILYRYGRGVKKDVKKAIEYYKMAIKMNDPNACYNLGLLYDKGEEVTQDYQKAREYYEKGEKLRNALSIDALGVL